MSELNVLNLALISGEFSKVKGDILKETHKLRERIQQLNAFNDSKRTEWERQLQDKALEVTALKIQHAESLEVMRREQAEARHQIQQFKARISAAEARKVKVLEPQMKQHTAQRARLEQEIDRAATEHTATLLTLYTKLEAAQRELAELSEQVYLEETYAS
jgi:chromosome segregation ATPase